MEKVNQFALAGSKVIEVIHWVAAALMAVLLVVCFAAWGRLEEILNQNLPELGTEVSTYGFQMVVVDGTGLVDVRAIALFAVCAVIVLSLMAMVFRNAHLILKKTLESTPFQEDNIRMLREIGIFIIAIPIIEQVFNVAARLAVGETELEIAVDLGWLVLGVLVLCLTQVFAHGMELERDVDGLM